MKLGIVFKALFMKCSICADCSRILLRIYTHQPTRSVVWLCLCLCRWPYIIWLRT